MLSLYCANFRGFLTLNATPSSNPQTLSPLRVLTLSVSRLPHSLQLFFFFYQAEQVVTEQFESDARIFILCFQSLSIVFEQISSSELKFNRY